MKIPRIVLSGTTSGVGKTSITCAIIYGLKKRGYTVQPFKVGPDYIDPSYLSVTSGNTAHNLDVWLMGRSELVNNFVKSSNSDMSVIEGVMGYYDGSTGKSSNASTYHVATLTKSNVVLILDAQRVARSVAATALGFTKFHRNSRISGIILNKIASKRHETMCKDALSSLKIPIIGVIPKNSEFSLESRHLGLVPAHEDVKLRSKIINIAKKLAEFLDFDQLVKIANASEPLPVPPKLRPARRSSCTVAVALDGSFNFYYPENLDALRIEGAKIKFFSPVSDKKLPVCDGIYIGGGFPEILSKPLSKNTSMRNSIKKSLDNNTPMYAECGGLMYLTKSIHDGKQRFPMVGFIDAKTVMTEKMTLNYTRAQVTSECVISKPRRVFYGHEFHYSKLDCIHNDTKFAYDLSVGSGIIHQKDGIIQNNTLASYGHLFFNNKTAKTFVKYCLRS